MKKPLELTNQKETNLKMKNPECLLRTTKGRAEPSSRFFKIQILSGSLVDNVPPLPIFGSGGGGAPCVPPCFSHFVCHCDFNPQRPKELCIKPSEQVKAKGFRVLVGPCVSEEFVLEEFLEDNDLLKICIPPPPVATLERKVENIEPGPPVLSVISKNTSSDKVEDGLKRIKQLEQSRISLDHLTRSIASNIRKFTCFSELCSVAMINHPTLNPSRLFVALLHCSFDQNMFHASIDNCQQVELLPDDGGLDIRWILHES
eukprot:TRINITY_DN9070_c1_g1_i11.p2 TRINITY_DN9070_c1_g1~~TRINITY_DN9070_c1_g1_i11.p2  ORF type:complete len:259 (+),score=61.10 TRINITY_DN9070_c1_g1_i11:1089-1865(+)